LRPEPASGAKKLKKVRRSQSLPLRAEIRKAGLLITMATVGLPALCGAASAQTQTASDRIDALVHDHKTLLARLDEFDRSVRVRVESGLRDQIEAWRLGLDDLDGAEYQKRLSQALEAAGRYGLDVERMRRLHDLTKAALLRADLAQPGARHPDAVKGPSGALAAFMDWAGREQVRDAEAAAALQDHRKELHRKVSLAYMEALLERDPGAAMAKFRAYSDALRQILAADADALVAEAEAIHAELEYVQNAAAGVPLLGDAFDLVALVEGRQPLTGETLGALDWCFALVGIASGPFGQLVGRIPGVDLLLARMVTLAEHAVEPLVATGRYQVDQLRAFVARFSGEARLQAALRDQGRRALAVQSDQVISRFRTSEAGAAANKVWAEANAQGAAKVSGLAKVAASKTTPAELLNDAAFMEAYKAVRQDKRAIAALKESDPALREKIFLFEEHLFGKVTQDAAGNLINRGEGLVDQLAIRELSFDLSAALRGGAASDEARVAAEHLRSTLLKAAAEKGLLTGGKTGESIAVTRKIQDKATGAVTTVTHQAELSNIEKFNIEDLIDPDNLRIEVFNASNKPPKLGDIGSDRDITYLLVLKDGTKIDVPHQFVANHYNKSLYVATNPGGLPMGGVAETRALVDDFAKKMDHTVTDGFAADAYNPGVAIGEFLGSKTPPRLSGAAAQDVADTFAFKGVEWFERGEQVMGADPVRGLDHMAEGMRQLTKQHDNLIVKRLNARGLTETANVPASLGSAVDVMKRVTTPGHDLPFGVPPLSPAEAEAAIKAMGFKDLRDLAWQHGQFFEALEKTGTGPVAVAR